ncbi:hypothetical protein MMC13_005381 [Lambiella insularis]|nr:hypothetical protein [Lambiella insularis]
MPSTGLCRPEDRCPWPLPEGTPSVLGDADDRIRGDSDNISVELQPSVSTPLPDIHALLDTLIAAAAAMRSSLPRVVGSDIEAAVPTLDELPKVSFFEEKTDHNNQNDEYGTRKLADLLVMPCVDQSVLDAEDSLEFPNPCISNEV